MPLVGTTPLVIILHRLHWSCTGSSAVLLSCCSGGVRYCQVVNSNCCCSSLPLLLFAAYVSVATHK